MPLNPHKLLAAAAAVAMLSAFPVAAGAQHLAASPNLRQAQPFASDGGCRSDRRGRGGHHGGYRCGGYAYGDGWAYADGEWALYNNRSWSSDSFNDWWHDRPDRAYPRWVQEQRNTPCEPNRMWWSGAGWRC